MDREEKKLIDGVNVTLSWPASPKPKGVVFLLSGSMIDISEYNGFRDVIVQQEQCLLVARYVNVFTPLRDNSRSHARNMKKVFEALRIKYADLDLPNTYTVIGHSAGGKIALMLAAEVDPESVSAVLALDPVDTKDTEFTNARGTNLTLDGRIPVTLTCTDGGLGIPKKHNAEAIHAVNTTTTLIRHEHAGHMAYTDNGGGLAGAVMPDVGTKEGNEKARSDAYNLVRQILGSK